MVRGTREQARGPHTGVSDCRPKASTHSQVRQPRMPLSTVAATSDINSAVADTGLHPGSPHTSYTGPWQVTSRARSPASPAVKWGGKPLLRSPHNAPPDLAFRSPVQDENAALVQILLRILGQ